LQVIAPVTHCDVIADSEFFRDCVSHSLIILPEMIVLIFGIIPPGVTYAGELPDMPARDKVLASMEFPGVAAEDEDYRDDPNWVPEALNFPRPLVTGKAYPEQELIIGGQYIRNFGNLTPGGEDLPQGTNSQHSLNFEGSLEYRLSGRTEVEVDAPVLVINNDSGYSTAGLGDMAVAVKYVLFFSVEHLTIVTTGLELGLPTGRSSKGLGSGELTWEPNIRAGWRWKELTLQGDMWLEVPQQTANTSTVFLYDVALGYTVEPDHGLELTPMVEVNTEMPLNGDDGGRTLSAFLPQMRIEWLAWSVAAGVQFPFTHLKNDDIQVLFDLTYEYSL
jgi:hypothetical protein